MGLRTMKRRRRENKTDYKLRKILLSGEIPRIVIRRTNRYFIVQIVESHEAQDKVILGVTSKDLLKKGWDAKKEGSLKSISAGYLTGLLLSKKIKKMFKNEKSKFIIDVGMRRTIKGSRIFSVVKGLIDGGINIAADKKIFPSEERISGSHLKPELKLIIEEVKKKI